MIRTEIEYEEARRRLNEGDRMMKVQEQELGKLGLSKLQIRRGMQPLATFQSQLREDVDCYKRLRQGDRRELANFQELGQVLIALRIVRGLSQRELADKLDVHESQVSRDERNEYHGVTVERANRISEVLGFELRYAVVPATSPRASRSPPPRRKAAAPGRRRGLRRSRG